jgi:hypothetical protein
MKKLFLTICPVLFACLCFAQATQWATKDSVSYLERFKVLKTDPKIRQGEYQLIVRSSGKILTDGFYKNNKRDGIWHEYDNSGYVIVEGHYKDGQKIGEWKYFDNLWKLANTYDFTKNQLTFHEPLKLDTLNRYRVVHGKDTVDATLSRAPIYLGGDLIQYRPLYYAVNAPAAASIAGVAGKVVISFTLDENSQVKDYHIDTKLGYGCDEEALRLIKMIPNNWVAGQLNGKNVAVIMRIPVGFDFRGK